MRPASLLLLCLSLACSKKEAPSAPAPDAGAGAEAAQEIASLARLEHARAPFGPPWQRFASLPAPEVRTRLAVALGRASDSPSIPTLARLLADPEAAVREAAAFGFGCFEKRAQREAPPILLARLQEETEPAVVGALLVAMGRIGGHTARLVLDRGLAHFLPAVREAAALGIGRLAADPASTPRLLAPRVLGSLLAETEPYARAAMAFALSRLGGMAPAALEDRNPGVRFFAAAAWGAARGATGGPLLPRLGDDDWHVRVAVLRSLSRLGPDNAEEIAKALRSAWAAFAASHDTLKSERVQVVLAAIEALAPHLPRGRKALEEVHWSSDVRESVIRYQRDALYSLDAVNCAASRALDTADGEPKRVLTCGAPRTFEWVQKRLAAQVVARTSASPPAQRVALLAPLLRDRDPRVRVAAAEALGPLGNAPGARALLLEGLRSRDPSVVGALAEAAAAHPGRDPELEAALVAAGASLGTGKDAEPMIQVAKALGLVGTPKSAPLLTRLAADPARAVAEAARQAFAYLFPADPAPPAGQAPLGGFPPPIEPDPPVREATVSTTKGEFTIALFASEAPLTVGNFVALARRGFYRGKIIHRVVSAFVTQMGDPRGDGTGGPGYSLPCELGPRRYRPGSVGMALAGRDTGGSQFFITHLETPHLDGAYTLFGEVTRGMGVVESLVEGDVLRDVAVK
jgi:cyclophilin family peptidyl-prolyl cis-trans isomerase/HEAT repeat protein